MFSDFPAFRAVVLFVGGVLSVIAGHTHLIAGVLVLVATLVIRFYITRGGGITL